VTQNVDFQLPVQKAVFKALSEDTNLLTLVPSIFDFVSDEHPFPYIQVGEADAGDWGTQSDTGIDTIITVNTWYRASPGQARGRARVRAIQAEIFRILHLRDLEIAGASTLVARRQFSNVLVEDDGVTYHGVCRFRFMIGGN
jgi:hypothetical protein